MLKVLATKASGTATTAGASVTCGETPFGDGEDATLDIRFSADTAGAGVIKLQGSDDGTTWTDIYTSPATPFPGLCVNVKCANFMRINPSTVFSAGTFSAYLHGVT